MNYNFLNCDEFILKAINEIQMLLQFSITKDGIPVILKEDKHGLSVVKDNEGVTITYDNLNSLFRGMFLMISNEHEDLLHIEQKASYKLGIMLDMSRNAVMNVDTLKDIVRHLAVQGYHYIQLYTEDTMEVEQEEYFGYMRGAYKKKEIEELVDYMELFGMELIPCIQTLAHINQITRYEHYDKIIDNTDILLVGEARTYELLEAIIKTAASNFKSRKINIGMDEAHMLGLGKYLDKHGYKRRFDIMIEHLEKVANICEKYGFEPQMWSDMFFRLVFNGEYYQSEIDDKTRALFDKIPKNIKLIYWDYYSVDYDHYKNNISIHKSISDNIGFAGGAWKWTGFAPDNTYSMLTGEQATKACKDLEVKDFLVTCWGDNGAEASVYSILPSIYFYAEKAYTSDFSKDGFKTLTGIKFDDYMKVDLPNRLVKSDYERNNASKFFLYNDILIGTFDSFAFNGIDDLYKKHALELKAVGEQTNKYKYIFKTLELLCNVLEIKANLGVVLKEAYDTNNIKELLRIKDVVLPELHKRLNDFYDAFSVQWHRDNKSFGFEVQCIRLGGLLTRVDYIMKRLQQYFENEIHSIEELEMSRKPFSYFENRELDKLIYNLWNVIATPSIM